jgi:hypothetical protein
MKAKKLAFVSSAFALLGSFVLGINAAEVRVNAENGAVSETTTTDYGAFKIRGGSSGSISTSDNAINYTGAWNSNFAVTDQFDTRSGNYSLKAHVYNADWTISDDGGTGFCIYYNDSNYITFFLKWNKGNSTSSFAEGIMLNAVNGQFTNSYQYAILPSGAFTTVTNETFPFAEAWGDAAWTVNGVTTNLFNSSTILANKGFDMTIHVERSTYQGRTVDVIQLQVDGFGSDGKSTLTAYSPKYAVDAFTNPLGNGTSALVDRKPQIGFQNWGMTNTSYSNIVFTDKNAGKTNAKITRVGAIPTTATVNAENDTLVYNNDNFASGFMMTDLATTATGSIDIQATVSGTKGNDNDTQLGFVYFFDNDNYATIYAKWDGTTATIDGVHAFFKVNGEAAGASAARDPWGNITTSPDYNYATTTTGFFDYPTVDWGWITDSPEPMTAYSNFNNMRSESTLTISSGFAFGLQRTRVTWLNRLADAFQFRVSAKGTDNVFHNWYSPTFCVDAYTCPNGGEASTLADKAPQIGFYSFKAGEITLSNIKYNGNNVEVSYSGKEEARIFKDAYMHLSDIPTTDGSKGTACIDKGYYADAKEGWTNLSSDARSAFLTDDEFAEGRARLIAWANANGDTLDNSNNLIAKSNSILKGISSSSDESNTVAIITVFAIAVSLSVTFIIIRKKKLSEK